MTGLQNVKSDPWAHAIGTIDGPLQLHLWASQLGVSTGKKRHL